MQTRPLNTLYSSALIALAQGYRDESPLADADVAVEMQSKLCGSIVNMELAFAEGKVAAHAITAQADALGRASVALVQRGVDGVAVGDLRAVIASARAAVLHDAPVPEALQPRWEGLDLLRSIHPYTNRHPSTLLVFEVLEECLRQYEGRHV